MILETIDGNMASFIYVDILKRRLLRDFPALSPYTVHGAELSNSDRSILQNDGAKVHKIKDVFKYFNDRDIQGLEFSPKSPDFNLIEGVWGELKSQFKRSYKDPRNWSKTYFKAGTT